MMMIEVYDIFIKMLYLGYYCNGYIIGSHATAQRVIKQSSHTLIQSPSFHLIEFVDASISQMISWQKVKTLIF